METQRHKDTEIEKINPVTFRIIGAAIEVHRLLGPGLVESIYEPALCVELQLRQLRYARQVPVAAMYKGHLVGEYRVDLIVEDSVVVEVKSVAAIAPIMDVQLRTYLRLTGKRLGLILNFNAKVMKEGVSRIVL